MARRSKHAKNTDDNTHRWLISYADFITLMFAFFVVMYSMSSVNEGKYRVLSETLQNAFSNTVQVDIAAEQLIELSPYKNNSIIDFPAAAPKAINGLTQLSEQIESVFDNLINEDQIIITGNETWVEISLNASLLFNSGEALINKPAIFIIQQLAGIMSGYKNPIRVEGFTDSVPIKSQRYPSNWELSVSRSAAIVRMLIKEGINPRRLSAVGYGEHQPIASNDTVQGQQKNRRVVFIVSKNLDVRKPYSYNNEPASDITIPSFLKEKNNVKTINLEGGGVLFTQGEE